MGMITLGDRVGRVAGWWTAFQYKLNDLKNKGWNEADAESEAAAFAERETSMVHPGGTVSDRNLAQTGNELLRSVTPFTGYWMKLTSLIRVDMVRPIRRAFQQSYTDGKFNVVKFTDNLFRVLVTGRNIQQFGTDTTVAKKGFWTIIIPSLMISMMRRGRPPEDEDEFVKDMWAYSLMSLPVFGPLIATHLAYGDDYKSTATIFDALDKAWIAGKKAYGLVSDVEAPSKNDIETFAEVTKYMGVPVTAIRILTDTFDREYNDNPTWDAIKTIFPTLDNIDDIEEIWGNYDEGVKDLLSRRILD
jgi:hypothetical protein